LLFLSDGTRNAGARRLLVWITDGFDLAPARFYGVDLPEPDLLAEFAGDGFRALSADGWIALTLAPPDEDPYRGKAVGVRIGTWRFVGVPFLFAGVHEPDRDPERSEAYLELGDQRLAAGDVEGAADAYDRAYYHYWGDPETGDRQAVALLRLSDCLWTLGDRDAARRARALAAELDPEIAARHLATDTLDRGGLGRPEVARLLDPEAPLRLLTEATSGAIVAKSSDLDDQLFDLRRRLRLTLQLPSELPQGLYFVKITWRGESVMAPGWLRVGELAAVVEARSRR
jgi:tetratricopeptide (TPR) repeat protein